MLFLSVRVLRLRRTDSPLAISAIAADSRNGSRSGNLNPASLERV